jgi:diguanylate cyclase (GGDEF)-like protein
MQFATSPDRGSETLSADETLETLLDAVQALSHVRTVGNVQEVVRSAARRLVRADGATFVLREGHHCFYADEDAISPLWKGQRFPMDACISGWAMIHGEPVVIPDIYADQRIPHEAYRPTFVKSLVMVPIRAADPLGAIGMYWAGSHHATRREVAAAQALADSTAVALEHARVLADLARTLALSQTDPVTDLPNRRAWDEVLDAAISAGRSPLCVALVDLDLFKAYNDEHGHPRGDALLRDAAAAWRSTLRGSDVLARFGGDEFAVLMPDCDDRRAVRIAERVRASTPAGQSVSVGLAQWDGRESAGALLARADLALYAAKRQGRGAVLPAPRS